MGVRSWLRSRFRGGQVAEAAPAAGPTAKQIRRQGYEYGIPLAAISSTSQQVAATSERQQILNQLHQLYMTCTWVSASIDVVARTVTAGGLQVVSTEDIPEGESPPDPPEVVRLKRLLRITNAREDMVQLLRNVVTDLLLFGDAYVEVVKLLGEPVALYGLDATTMTVISDQHGEVTGYSQDVDGVRSAKFAPDEVIHISMDAPRGGLYGVGPAQKVLLPATAWLFTMATIKECFRRGDPPRLHVDLGHYTDPDVQRWREQYRVFNLGAKGVGEPVITTGGGSVGVLDPRKVTDYLDAARQLRDEIISGIGVPPAKVGIIESGNLGSGTGETQDKTFRINMTTPIGNLILEKFNYHLVLEGFGIQDFQLQIPEIDMRDSKVVEEIRDLRLRNGSYTINRYRDEIGEPPIDGGDIGVFVDRQGVTSWDDMAAMSKAQIAQRVAPLTAAGVNGYVPGVPDADLDPTPDPTAPTPDQDPDALVDPQDAPGFSKDAAQGEPPEESGVARDQRQLSEAWHRAYRARRRQALKDLPGREAA